VRDKMITRENYAISVPESSALGARIDVAMVDELRSPWRRDVVQRHLGSD
jgi:hypothetical protein